MFGQKDDNASDKDANTADENQAGAQPEPTLISGEGVSEPAPVASAATAPSSDDSWQHPGDPLVSSDDSSKDVISPAGGFPSSASNRLQTSGPVLTYGSDDNRKKDEDDAAALVSHTDVADAGLVDIKQKALSELSPLVDKLDQPPEEKFRTIMMMIQASDDQALVKQAYEAAHGIEDDKVRAQALLDIVNEINYFTQQPAES